MSLSLSSDQKWAILEHAAELPPFGFTLFSLKQRVDKQTKTAVQVGDITAFLRKYYVMEEWQRRSIEQECGEQQVFALPPDWVK
jgi:hypothetical protein